MGSGFAETQFLLGSVLPGGWVFSNLWVQVLQKHNFSVLPGGWVFSNYGFRFCRNTISVSYQVEGVQ
ncbi:hypothetical protein GBAR_LOCUS31461 [Geodia barretti]|uniref:Uncharacterized protein n=1 Tax=Geodia barretti TaxID=519541 RepID=A0AA35XGB2_GEOBA|nr:hypothetical protein GBAR_LOCUS31461 [Geodia barretti]